MALTLIEPGARKGNKHFLIRGSYKGVVYEKATGTTDPKLARSLLRQFKEELERTALVVRRDDRVTFADAWQAYVRYREPSREDRRRGEALLPLLGKARLADITPAVLHDLAVRMYPRGAAATRNRQVLRPAITALHYAANAGLCPWLRVKAFKEPRPKTRAVDLDVAAALIEAAKPGPQRLLLTWLFYQGTRISDTLRVRWEDVDLVKGVVHVHVSKTDVWENFPLHDVVRAGLLDAASSSQSGPVFPWARRTRVYRWLSPLVSKLGISFTPHMARHTLGTQLAAGGASLSTIMKALGHSSAAASLRYQAADIETVRAAVNSIEIPKRNGLGRVVK